MEERRRSKRTDLHSRLLVKRIDTSGQEEIAVDVKNVSKTGIGFYCNEILDMGAVYEAYLTIWTKEVIHAFIEIVRIEKIEDGYEFGGLFIGMPEIDLQRIDVYNAVNDAENYNDK
ncbi:MAG: PilZ domain-containing protein [Lachnospiraceae bacterium]|nr:PilZ domain-containing protein [Lachnospiraceae bacterium]MDE6920469.1 PilZ domain-containing protein [Lachnospiraceae bacterium]MDE7001531.1 PilZ domain-containing protein [Lachnospiraceae bacterium]